ncbi:MAG: serine/threonine protein kinase [Polyangiaceae bacterium]
MTKEELRRFVVGACVDVIEGRRKTWSKVDLAEEAGEGVQEHHVADAMRWMATQNWVTLGSGGDVSINGHHADAMRAFSDPLLEPPKTAKLEDVPELSEERVGSWVVLRHVDGGGQADVSLVRHADDGRFGALKRLRPHLEHSQRDQTRFRREIEAFERLGAHPGIVELLDHDKKWRWFVTRYAPLGSLQGHLPRFRGDALRVLRVGRDLAVTLDDVHAKNIIHRDLKPANVLLASWGHAMLADFGIAHATDDTRVTTQHAAATRWYSPPWARDGSEFEPDPTLDTHALGKLIYTMLAGGRRFTNTDGFASGKNELATYLDRPELAPVTDLLSHLITDTHGRAATSMRDVVERIDATTRLVLSTSAEPTRTAPPGDIPKPPSAVERNVRLKALQEDSLLPIIDVRITKRTLQAGRLRFGVRLHNLSNVPALHLVLDIPEETRMSLGSVQPSGGEATASPNVSLRVPPPTILLEYAIVQGYKIRDHYALEREHRYELRKRELLDEPAFELA